MDLNIEVSVLNFYFLNWAKKVVQCIECIDKISICDVNIIRMQHAFPLLINYQFQFINSDSDPVELLEYSKHLHIIYYI